MCVGHSRKNHNGNAPLTSDKKETREQSSARHVCSRLCSSLTALFQCLFKGEGRLRWEGLG